jgi:hypothetical protein
MYDFISCENLSGVEQLKRSAVIAALVCRRNVGVSLILDFAWSVFSANCLSMREPSILPLRVIRIRPSPSSRRPQDEWRRTIALVRSERGSCIVCLCTPRAKFGFKSAAEQCAVAGRAMRRGAAVGRASVRAVNRHQ